MAKIIKTAQVKTPQDGEHGFLCDLGESFAISAIKAFNRRVR